MSGMKSMPQTPGRRSAARRFERPAYKWPRASSPRRSAMLDFPSQFQGFRQGSEEACRYLVRRYNKPVYLLVRRLAFRLSLALNVCTVAAMALLLFFSPGILTRAAATSESAEGSGIRLEVAETSSHFFAGETVYRTVAVENKSSSTLSVPLVWRVMAEAATLQQGRLDLIVPAGGVTTSSVSLRMPEVKRLVVLHFLVFEQTTASSKGVLRMALRVYPRDRQLAWEFLRDKKVGIWPPSDLLRSWFERLGARPRALEGISRISDFEGDLLMAGPGAFRDARTWRAFHEALEKRGAPIPVIVLRQDWLPGQATVNDGSGAPEEREHGCSAVRCVREHPLLRQFEDGDFVGWRGLAGVGNLPFLSPPAGNFRRLLLAGGGKTASAEDALILERPFEKGLGILYCQVPLLEAREEEPVAEILFNQVLRYALANTASLTRQGIVLCGSSESPALLKVSQYLLPRKEDEQGDADEKRQVLSRVVRQAFPAGDPGAVILDASSKSAAALLQEDSEFSVKVRKYVRAGGILVVLGMPEETRRFLDWASDERDTFAPHSGPGPAPALWREGSGKVLFVRGDLSRASAGTVRLTLGELLTNLGVLIPFAEGEE